MTEWAVLGVIITVLGLIATVMAPVVYVTRTLAKTTTILDRLQGDQEEDRKANLKAHEKLWARSDEQGKALQDHEVRLQLLENDE